MSVSPQIDVSEAEERCRLEARFQSCKMVTNKLKFVLTLGAIASLIGIILITKSFSYIEYYEVIYSLHWYNRKFTTNTALSNFIFAAKSQVISQHRLQ